MGWREGKGREQEVGFAHELQHAANQAVWHQTAKWQLSLMLFWSKNRTGAGTRCFGTGNNPSANRAVKIPISTSSGQKKQKVSCKAPPGSRHSAGEPRGGFPPRGGLKEKMLCLKGNSLANISTFSRCFPTLSSCSFHLFLSHSPSYPSLLSGGAKTCVPVIQLRFLRFFQAPPRRNQCS